MKNIALFFLACCFQSIAFSQSDGFSEQYDFLRNWNEQLTPSHSVGEWAARGFPANEAPEMEGRLAIMRQQAEAQAQMEQAKQKVAKAALQAAWAKSWEDGQQNIPENQSKALMYDISLAKNGDYYGEYRMGQRCRDGEGVPKDLQKAREWFTKSAAQGVKSAAKELGQLMVDFPELATTNNPPAEIKPPLTITPVVSTNK